MTLIVGENSYGTLEEADAYFTEMGKITTWNAVGDDTVKEGLMHQAFEYMGTQYDPAWKGYRTSTTQKIAWPRTGVTLYDNLTVDANTIPDPVKRSQFKLSLIMNTTELLPIQTNDSLIEKKTGPLTKKWNRNKGASAGVVDVPEIIALLKPYLNPDIAIGESGIVSIIIGV